MDLRHVGILSITGKEFNWEKIRLRTVRPFVMREIILSEVPRFAKKASDTGKEAVIKYLREQVPLNPSLAPFPILIRADVYYFVFVGRRSNQRSQYPMAGIPAPRNTIINHHNSTPPTDPSPRRTLRSLRS